MQIKVHVDLLPADGSENSTDQSEILRINFHHAHHFSAVDVKWSVLQEHFRHQNNKEEVKEL